MQLGTREELGYLLNKLNLTGVGIEVGVADADFSEILLQTSKLELLVLLDAWKNFDTGYTDRNNLEDDKQEERYLNVLKRMMPYEQRTYIIRAKCENAVKTFSNEMFDFVYLDANHSYEFVSKSLRRWYPKVKKGGLFAGHDYLDGTMSDGTVFGVKRAVNEFVEELGNVKLYSTTDDTPFVGNSKTLIEEDKRYFSWYFIRQ